MSPVTVMKSAIAKIITAVIRPRPSTSAIVPRAMKLSNA